MIRLMEVKDRKEMGNLETLFHTRHQIAVTRVTEREVVA
jgi:hypothetical protein